MNRADSLLKCVFFIAGYIMRSYKFIKFALIGLVSGISSFLGATFFKDIQFTAGVTFGVITAYYFFFFGKTRAWLLPFWIGISTLAYYVAVYISFQQQYYPSEFT